MAFTDLNFLSRFIPLVIIIYLLSPRRLQPVVLLCSSIVFYSFGDLKFLPLLAGLCLVNYLFAQITIKAPSDDEEDGSATRYPATLAAIVAIDAGVLVIFKVIMVLTGAALPLGLSFYIFKMISFQADLYTGRIREKPSFIMMSTYFAMFFQITQGPIMRYRDKLFDYSKRRLSLVKLEQGLKYLIIGLAMKVLLADRLAILWNDATRIGFEGLSTPLAWLAAIGYSLELYLDFWGYSLMASGIGVMMGFDFVENFHHPYAAATVGEFYRRWHMTLTSWFRDYVYIPLGGSKKGRESTVLNILLVWLLTGFWHGGGVNFIIWGMILGFFIAFEKVCAARFFKDNPLAGHLYVLIVIPVTWSIFAIGNAADMQAFLLKLFPLTGKVSGANSSDFVYYLGQFFPYLAASVALCVPKVFDSIEKKREGAPKLAEAVILTVLLWISLYLANISDANPFMYFYF